MIRDERQVGKTLVKGNNCPLLMKKKRKNINKICPALAYDLSIANRNALAEQHEFTYEAISECDFRMELEASIQNGSFICPFVTEKPHRLVARDSYIGPLSEVYELMYKEELEEEPMDFFYLDVNAYFLSIGKLHSNLS